MSRSALLISAAAACLLLAAQSPAQAQTSNRSISRPQVNPYSDFLRYNSGLYDPMVRPFMRQNTPVTRRQMGGGPATIGSPTGSALLGGSSTYGGQRNPEVERAQLRSAASAQRATVVAPTGTGSTFMQYSHYYPVRQNRRR